MTKLLPMCLLAACAAPSEPTPRTGTACPLDVVREVNDAWIASHPDPGDNKWARAVYFVGNTAAARLTSDTSYLAYARAWSERNGWSINRGIESRNADDHAAGQTYLMLHSLDPQPARITELMASMEHAIDHGCACDWSWIDAFFMDGPVFAQLAATTGDPRYSEALYQRYWSMQHARGLFAAEAGLWFRDRHFRYPTAQTGHGHRVLWARGNGWVIAALASILELLPPDDAHRAEYAEMLSTMAHALVPLQHADGLWRASLHDAAEFPDPETSGTAFFLYAMARGVSLGILDPAIFTPAIERGWRGLASTVLHEDGSVGFVQGVADEPSDDQPVTLASTRDYGTGAVLMAGAAIADLELELDCDD